jgi:hypothetical protein
VKTESAAWQRGSRWIRTRAAFWRARGARDSGPRFRLSPQRANCDAGTGAYHQLLPAVTENLPFTAQSRTGWDEIVSVRLAAGKPFVKGRSLTCFVFGQPSEVILRL